jgi:hypothetical protein
MADAIVSTLREDLEAAIEAPVESSGPASPPADTSAATAEEAPETAGAGESEAERVRKRDEAGRFAKEEEDRKAEQAKKEKPAAPPAPGDKPPATEKPAAPSPQTTRAPQSWKPDAREEWAKLSPRVQQEVVRREGEVQRALQESSEARQGYQKYREATAPFENMIRAEGGDVLQAVQGLLQTAHMLRTAPPQVRAAGIARMVASFLPGREGLELLDAALSGQAPQAQPQQQFRDPRLDPLLAEIEQMRATSAQQKQAEAAKSVQEVAQEEFFEDVRQDMADLIEVAQRRGVVLSLRDAYTRAVNLHPEISKVLAQRSAVAARNPTGSTQRAKAASSSVRSSPVVAPKGEREAGRDMRSDLEAAIESLDGAGR